jgi:hypothetical protein
VTTIEQELREWEIEAKNHLFFCENEKNYLEDKHPETAKQMLKLISYIRHQAEIISKKDAILNKERRFFSGDFGDCYQGAVVDEVLAIKARESLENNETKES